MINATKDKLVFVQTGEQLHNSTVAALRLASKWILRSYGWDGLDLGRVNTKSYKEAIVPALIDEFILRSTDTIFSEEYAMDAFELVRSELTDVSPVLYSRLTISATSGKRSCRKSYLPGLRRGFAAFLVALHIQRAIVLPYSFAWPIGFILGKNGRVLARREICPLDELPELLCFLRSLYDETTPESEAIFSAYSVTQRIRLADRGVHVILATGWLTIADANYDDLLSLCQVNKNARFASDPHFPALMLADVFEQRYQSRSPITAAGWQAHFARATRELQYPNLDRGSANLNLNDETILGQAMKTTAAQMAPANLAMMTRLPGLGVDLRKMTKDWLTSQQAYFKKVKRENYKGPTTAIGYLNTYLFSYLPYWFAANPEFPYAFPDTPNKLIGTVFISDLGLIDEQAKPVTLVDFCVALASHREWGTGNHYATLKQIEIYFEFVEKFRDQLPGCTGFKQPLSTHDFPRMARSYGTNKRPIPRRMFKFYISYIDALVAYADVLLERVLSGVLADTPVGLRSKSVTTIDCFALQDLIGFIPVVFHRGKTIPLRRIPNVLCVERKRLKDGRVLRIPHPHALHQILVAFYTGLRHNHIQWLDADTFDSLVDDEEGKFGYAELLVNTDKSKSKAWRSHVNFRVIELLRAQLAWRNLIGEPKFSNRVFYNNNPYSKWGQFYPLFAYFENGTPHSDALYARVWTSLLSGVQSMLLDIDEPSMRLVRLLPDCVPYTDPDQLKKLYEYGSQQQRICALIPKSDITPHSARVSVVSHLISILPADMIGRHVTGQTESMVFHYVVLDEGEINAEQWRQNLMMRQRGYEQGYEAMLEASPGRKGPFIKADDVNSSLARSLRTNIEETISAHGCVSLSLNGEEKTGLDVLRETRALGVVANKTELCPFGNHCPTEVVAALGGFRRCGPCHYAVRSVDHLPAITAKIRQVIEGLTEIEARLDADDAEALTSDEWDVLAKDRDLLAEDLAAWQMAGEVLEVMRQRVAAGDSAKIWHVQRPEIIEQHLKRELFPTGTTDYLLARLHESEAFPVLESPQIRARFDLLRRKLLANVGNIREALRLEQSTNPAAECLGLIRSIASANQLGIEDLRRMLESNEVSAVPNRTLHILPSAAM